MRSRMIFDRVSAPEWRGAASTVGVFSQDMPAEKSPSRSFNKWATVLSIVTAQVFAGTPQVARAADNQNCAARNKCEMSHEKIMALPENKDTGFGLTLEDAPLTYPDGTPLVDPVTKFPFSFQRVTSVNPVGPAHVFGIVKGDYILNINHNMFLSAADADHYIRSISAHAIAPMQIAKSYKVLDTGHITITNFRQTAIFSGFDQAAYETIGPLLVVQVPRMLGDRKVAGALILDRIDHIFKGVVARPFAPMELGDTIDLVDGKSFNNIVEMKNYLEHPPKDNFYLRVVYASARDNGEAHFASYPLPENVRDAQQKALLEALGLAAVGVTLFVGGVAAGWFDAEELTAEQISALEVAQANQQGAAMAAERSAQAVEAAKKAAELAAEQAAQRALLATPTP